MALGLNRIRTGLGATPQSSGISLISLLENPIGFPANYLPKMRIVDGVKFICTHAKGHDSDNSPVFYKWIFINPVDQSATIDSDAEYAKIPQTGFIMRIMQRSLLPYHENFVIDYYEDINSMRVIAVKEDVKQQFHHKMDGSYRSFPIGDGLVPSELKQEIFSYPEAFFKMYIQNAIPHDLFYAKTTRESNHMSAYGSLPGIFNSPTMPSLGNGELLTNAIINNRQPSPFPTGGRPINTSSPRSQSIASMNAADIQNRINQQVRNASSNLATSTNKPKTIDQTGLRYRSW